MTNVIFLTGAAGFLGTELAAAYIRQEEGILYALVRAADEASAYHRLRAAWHHDSVLTAALGKRVFPVTGDFTEPGLGLSAGVREKLKREITMVIHAGAETGLQKEAGELIRVNRTGTARVLAFSRGIRNLRRFVFISTAYACGKKDGTVREEDSCGEAFATIYEKSKAQAEALVRKSGLPFSICRPGMIVGHSETGRVKKFNTVYYILKLMLTGRLPVLPVKPDLALNMIPVDCVARDVLRIAGAEEAENRTFHLTCPDRLQPRAVELYDYVRQWAKRNLKTELPEPVFLPVGLLGKAGLAYNRQKGGKKKSILTNLLAISPYFTADRKFDRSGTDAVCGTFTLRWRSYMDALLSFACRKNFLQQTEWTVFEQAMVRRASRTYPMHFYDVSRDNIKMVSGEEVNRRVGRITEALRAWGLGKGDKIALTGINSVDYMTIDQAIGLIGAVSVPLYYTTPIDEVRLLLARSGAAWLFVGDRRIMEHIEALPETIRVVSFSDGLTVAKPNVMPLEMFLEKTGGRASETAPDPDDLATIRYTSGTTGEPKGVKFSYGQLAWMGEVLTNLLPWQERNRSMRYLSFLPLSHVVEGILASYAPYYVAADVDYYFLNDFGTLAEMLPKVRPNVFFSVPRFYEKLWDQFSSNRLGKRYLAMQDGPVKQALGRVLRRILLRKAGLDACCQLIVGSAPISEQLLLHFRELGIEIYNAYGQAEAPLITINRLGENEIPTIGTPLPDTEVTAAADGELIVKGPQVCLGYYGLETDTVRDGVLMTGDLGMIREDGRVILYGRKKEMIITAYGKNISIPKIEERLKDIDGVSEAVLIGERKPYCTALLWLDREVPDLDGEISKMNEGLSHPETIRRYTVIKKPLSIAAGELTPNLKVRRANVEQHFAEEIGEMYR